jgi:hypothetical protein
MDTHETPQPSKGFFHTLPGIITGIAALITAIGGLVITLNQTGCFGTRATGEDGVAGNVEKTSNLQATNNTANEKEEKRSANSQSAATTGQSKVTFSTATANYSPKQIAFTIKDAQVESLPGGQVLLKVKIKCVNESAAGFNFGTNTIRARVNDDKFVPEDSSPSRYLETVDRQSFKTLEFYFKLPAEAKKVDLLLYDYADPAATLSLQIG